MRLRRHDQAQATEKYNHINKWNTSQVTDMSQLFKNYEEFNDNISEWDVSHETNMSYMFYGKSSLSEDVVIDVNDSPPTMNSNPKETTMENAFQQ